MKTTPRKLVVLAVFAVLLAGMGAAYNSPVSEIVFYRANDTSTVTDFSGNNNDGNGFSLGSTTGVSKGSGEWDTGLGYDMDGSTSHVTLPSGLISTSDSFSTSTWLNPDSLSGNNGNQPRIVVLRDDIKFLIQISDGTNCPAGELSYWTGSFHCTGYSMSTNTLYHVATTYSEVDNKIWVYVNGSLVNSQGSVDPASDTGSSSEWGTEQGASQRYFDGMLDELHIDKQNWTAQEVSNIYNQNTIQSLNNPPTINSNATEPASPVLNDDINITANVTDPDGDAIANVSATVLEDGVQIADVPMPSTTGDLFKAVDAFTSDETNVWYNITITADDGTATSTSELTFRVEDNAPTLTVNDPKNQSYNTFPPYNVLINDTDDVPGETFNWAVWVNNAQEATGSGTENLSISGFLNSSSQGFNTFKVNATDDAGNLASQTVNYSFDNQPPKVDIQYPSGNVSLSGGFPLSFNFNYTATDTNLDTCIYQFNNNGTNITAASCNNVTDAFTVNSIGDYTAELWANDTLGNGFNYTTTSFFADHTNDITLEDADTSATIQDFSVTYTNGTDSFGGSTSDGTFEFNTSRLPTGSVNITLSSTGYNTRILQDTVTASYNLSATYQMQAASFSFQVKDEATQTPIPYNATFTNGTTQKTVTNKLTNSTTLSASGGPATKQMGTYNLEKLVAVDNLTYDAGTVNYCNNFEFRLNLFNGTTLTKSTSNCADGSLTFTNTDLVDTVDVYVTLNDGGVNPENAEILSTTFRDDDLSGFGTDYSGLANNGFPTGSLTVTVENTEYQPRTYYTTLSGTSTVSLTAYLLGKGEGIFMNVEVLDPSSQLLEGATVTIQRLISNNYVTVAQQKTATSGTASFYLDPSRQYQVLVTHPQYSSFQGTFTPSNYQLNPLTIQLGATSQFTISPVWTEVEYMLKPDKSTVPAETVPFNFTITDSDGSLTNFGITVKNGTNVLNSTTVSGSPSGGTAAVTANLSQFSAGQRINVSGTFTRNGNTYRYTRLYRITFDFTPGPFSLETIVNDFKSKTDDVTQSAVILILVLVFGVAFGKRLSPKGGGLVVVLLLAGGAYYEMIDPFVFLITLLTVIGLIALRR